MAFSSNGGELANRQRFRRTSAMADINVVPLVDVVLVLLIIFMLTAHVMEFGLQVDVPQVRQVKDTAEELPVVTLTKDGRLYLNENLVDINNLAAEVEKRFGKGRAIYLRADKATIWDPMAQVISALDEAQVKINLVTRPVDETASRRR